MSRVDALGVIAGMTDTKTFRDGADEMFVRYAVRSIIMLEYHESSVPIP